MACLLDLIAEPYWWLVGVFFVATLVLYFFDARYRNTLDAELVSDAQPLGMFELSHGKAAEARRDKRPVAPERLWTYDDEYMEKFADAAWSKVLRDRYSALDLYVELILRRWDLRFAVAMGLFTAFFNYGVATAILTACPFASRLVLLAAGMGILYGVADVAENLKLSSILKYPKDIDAGEVSAANFLTRLKIVSLTLSVSGGIFFMVLYLLTPLCGKYEAPVSHHTAT